MPAGGFGLTGLCSVFGFEEIIVFTVCVANFIGVLGSRSLGFWGFGSRVALEVSYACETGTGGCWHPLSCMTAGASPICHTHSNARILARPPRSFVHRQAIGHGGLRKKGTPNIVPQRGGFPYNKDLNKVPLMSATPICHTMSRGFPKMGGGTSYDTPKSPKNSN